MSWISRFLGWTRWVWSRKQSGASIQRSRSDTAYLLLPGPRLGIWNRRTRERKWSYEYPQYSAADCVVR